MLFVDIALEGTNGEIECHADETLTVSVQGGELLAFGSAKPKTEEVFHSGTYPTHYGRSLAAVLIMDSNIRIDVKGTSLPAAHYETTCR